MTGRILLLVGLLTAAAGCHSSTTQAAARRGPSPSTSPRSGPPRMVAAPSRALTDHARVTLRLTGFRAEEKVFFSECGPGQKPSPLVGCGQQAAAEPFTITDAYGAGDGAVFRVSARVRGQRCGSRCAIAAVGGGELVTVRITFR